MGVQVRTVAAFGMEQFTVDKYDKALEFPERVRHTLRHSQHEHRQQGSSVSGRTTSKSLWQHLALCIGLSRHSTKHQPT